MPPLPQFEDKQIVKHNRVAGEPLLLQGGILVEPTITTTITAKAMAEVGTGSTLFPSLPWTLWRQQRH